MSGAARLTQQLLLAGIPVVGVSQTADGYVVEYDPSATPAQIAQGNAMAAATAPGNYRPRKLYDIVQSLNALTAVQKTNISNDLFGGLPPKWTQDTGPNAADLLVLYTLTLTTGLSTADKNTVRLHAAAIYVMDNPLYLLSPPFDPTISAAGDEPA